MNKKIEEFVLDHFGGIMTGCLILYILGAIIKAIQAAI